MNTLRKLQQDDQGLSTVEYIIILFLIAVAAIGVWTAFGETLTDKVDTADGEIQGI